MKKQLARKFFAPFTYINECYISRNRTLNFIESFNGSLMQGYMRGGEGGVAKFLHWWNGS